VTTPTNETHPPLVVEVRASDGALLVDGVVYAEGTKAARLRAELDYYAGGPVTTTRDVQTARRVLAFLGSAADRAARATAPVTGPVPAPPARPRVRLRTEVEVDGLPAVDVGVYVYPSATDTAHAVTSAARALHDAALAALHVLVVEPAEPAGGAS